MFTVLQTRLVIARTFSLTGLVDWLIKADYRFREQQKLMRTPEHLLKDMGLTRADARRAHSRRTD